MAIPDFQSFFRPVLLAMADKDEHPTPEIRMKVASIMNLSREDLDAKLPSGVQTVFSNRVAWGLVYLTKANALRRPRRGVFQIWPTPFRTAPERIQKSSSARLS